MSKDRKKIIREIIDEVIDEISASDGAGNYATPHSFGGHTKMHKSKVRHTTQRLGYELTKQGEEELNRPPDSKEGDPPPPIKPKYPLRLQEARSRYNKFKLNQEMTSRQKITTSLRDAKRNLREVTKIVKMLRKYKNEFNYSSDSFPKRAINDIYKIEELATKLSHHLKELRL